MRAGFFPKLALSGIIKNGKSYIPYILSCIGCVSVFYIVVSMANDEMLPTISGGVIAQSAMMLGTVIIGIFAALLLFYTNSFLIKRRKKELGLYNVLGMDKRHIMRLIFFETLFIAVFSIAVGLVAGMLLSKLMLSVFLKILGLEVVFAFNVSVVSVITTGIIFGAIFFLNLLLNIFRVGVNNPMELLHGGQKGEKEPKSNIPLALIGLLCLGGGYYIAVIVKDPVIALVQFFGAVILVIIGTYALVTAGSTVILKALKKNKHFYYKPTHFISVSGMLYRMKQNAAGIATICILSTMVLVTVSTTFCLYFGLDDIADSTMSEEATLTCYWDDNTIGPRVDEAVKKSAEKAGAGLNGYYGMYFVSSSYTRTSPNTFSAASGASASSWYISFTSADLVSNKAAGNVGPDEALVYSSFGYGEDTINFGGKTYKVVEPETDVDLTSVLGNIFGDKCVVVLNSWDEVQGIFGQEDISGRYMASFNGASPEESQKISEQINTDYHNEDNEFILTSSTKMDLKKELQSMYGSFLFLGVFLGLLFIMATVLIMYYKQTSEGYDDKERFSILERVGMSQAEIKKTIRSQVLMVFFIPLILAVIHIAFAFNMITLIMAMMGLTNIMVFLIYTVGSVVVFAVVYTMVYAITARTYYRIVR